MEGEIVQEQETRIRRIRRLARSVEDYQILRHTWAKRSCDEVESWVDDKVKSSVDMGAPDSIGTPKDTKLVWPLRGGTVLLKGDVTFTDALRFLNTFTLSVLGLDVDDMLKQLQEFHHGGDWEFLVMCRDEPVYFISSDSWDEGVAFEISRNGKSLGIDQVPSGIIVVVTKKLLDLLLKESGEDGGKLIGGISVRGVNGHLIRSGDGDFIVTSSAAAACAQMVDRWIEDEFVLDADILCATGGPWTFCEDSSDVDDVYSEDSSDVDDVYSEDSRDEEDEDVTEFQSGLNVLFAKSDFI